MLSAACLFLGGRAGAQSVSPAGFAAVNASSLTVSWTSSFGAGQVYYTQISTGAFPNSFSGNQSSNTANLYATFASLTGQTTYYAQLSTSAGSGPYVNLGSTNTLAYQPGSAVSTFSAVTTNQITISWTSGTATTGYDVPGTTYVVLSATVPDFSSLFGTVQTTNTYTTTPAGLNPDTTYYIQVAALNFNGAYSAFTNLGSTSTLAVPPGQPSGSTFTAVTISALTVKWAAGAGSLNGPGTVYVIQISTNSNFNTLWASTPTTNLNQSFSGLAGNQAYYAQVQALNNSGGSTAFTNLGSTVTSTSAGITAQAFSSVFATSVTANWFSAYGAGTTYYTTISTGSTVANTFSGNVSSNTYNLFATLTGLSSNATYYAWTATAAAGPYTSLGSLSTLSAPPGPAVSTFSAVTTNQLSVSWSSGTAAGGYNLAGTTYTVQISSMPSFVPLFGSAQTTSFLLTTPATLPPDTTYYLQVAALGNNGVNSAFTNCGSTSTLAVPPGQPSGSTFTAVTIAALTVSWSSGTTAYNGAGTVYLAQISTNSNFNTIWASTPTANLSQSFSGLAGSQVYYAQVQALNNSGGATAFTALGSTLTSTNAGISGTGFYNIYSSSFSTAWTSAFAPGTTYYTTVSTGAFPNSFSGNVSSNTYNLFATFAGLGANTTYYAQTATAAAGPFTALSFTVTQTAAPGAPASSTFTGVATNGMTVNWSSGTAATGYDASGTLYTIQAATVPSFSPVFGTLQTSSLFATVAGSFSPNTIYYFQVQALSNSGLPTAFTSMGSTSTLAVAPSTPVGTSTFTAVNSSSFTVNWSSGTAGGGYNPAGTQYLAQVSLQSNFSTIGFSSQTANLFATITGLVGNTTYYVQVQAINNNGVGTAFTNMGSTLTAYSGPISPAGFTGVGANGLTVNWTSGFAGGTTYYTQLSSGAFPNGFSGNQSSNTLNLFASFTGLSANATYYAQISTSAGAGPYTSLGSTATLAVVPGSAAGTSTFTALTTTGLTLNWSSGTTASGYNASGTLYQALLSTMASFSPVAATSQTANLNAAFTGLTSDATYYAEVQAVNLSGIPTAFANLGSTVTPAALPGVPGVPFLTMNVSSLTVSWSNGGNAAGTTFYAQISTMATFAPVQASSGSYNLFASFTGLAIDTTYFARAAAYDIGSGTWTAFSFLGSSSTLAVDPSSSAFAPSPTAQSVQINWTSGTQAGGYDPTGTQYVVSLSTLPDFSVLGSSVVTTALTMTFSGLGPNVTYYFAVAALNNDSRATAFFNLGSTPTLAIAPSAPAATFTAVSPSGLTLNWLTGSTFSGFNSPSTLYEAQLATSAAFTTIVFSSRTYNPYAVFSALPQNVVYYAQARAINSAGVATSFTNFTSTATSAQPPGAAAFSAIGTSSLTVNFTANGDLTGTTYYVQISTRQLFNPILASSVTFNLSATFTGLAFNTTVYAQVAAFTVPGSTWSAFTNLGDTITWAVPPDAPVGVATFTGVSATGLTLSWSSGTAAGGYNSFGTLYFAEVSTDATFAFVSGSSLTSNLSFAFPGLGSDATYYAQVQALNRIGVPTAFRGYGSTTTTAAVPLSAVPAFSAVASAGLTVNWVANGDVPGTIYNAQISTMASFNPILASSITANLSAAFGSLNPNATYYAQAAAYDIGAAAWTAFAGLGSTATLAVAPGAASSTYTAVSALGLTLNWSSGAAAGGGFNPAGTLYLAQVSTASNFSVVSASSQTYNLNAAFASLSPNTTYYAEALAYNIESLPSAFTSFGSTVTLAVAPGQPVSTFTPVSQNGLTVNWSSGAAAGGYDPAGTLYEVDLSTVPGFSPLAASSQTYNLAAAFSGLNANQPFYARAEAFNAAGTPTAFTSLGSTATLAAPPGLAAFSAVGIAGLTVNWTSGGNVGGTTYYAQISTMASFNPILASSSTFNLAAIFSGLSVDATYYAQAAAYSVDAGTWTAFTSLGSTVTLAVPPASAVSVGTFTAVFSSSLTVNWSSGTPAGGYDPPGALYVAQASTMASFSPLTASSQTANLSATFTGLVGNVTYYLQVQALNFGGTPTAFINLGSTATRSGPPSVASPAFSGVGVGGLTASWIGGSPPGTAYYAQISTMASFNPILASSQTQNFSAGFSGLSPNVTYYAQAAAYDVPSATWTAFTTLGSTSTLAAPPGQPVSTFSAVSATGLTFGWQAGGDPAGTVYLAQLSLSPGFASIAASSQTQSLSASFAGLSGNGTYYAQAEAINNNGIPSAFTSLGSTVTLVLPPGSLSASTFTAVAQTALTVNWSSGTAAAGYDAPGTWYLVDLSTMAGFVPLAASSQTYNLNASFSGLSPSVVYYAQVQAIGNGGASTAFVSLGSTSTLGGLVGTGFSGVSASSLTVLWSSTFGGGTLYYAQLSSGPFPNSFAGNQSSNTFNPSSAGFAGLAPDATYYAEVSTAAAGPFYALGSTATLAAVPGASAAPFSGMTTSGLTISWTSGTAAGGYNPLGTTPYLAQISTSAGFSPAVSSQTYNLSASFAGLTPSATYFAQVSAISFSGIASPFASLSSSSTLAVPPGLALSTFSAVTGSGLTLNWSSGSAASGFNAAGTPYLAQISTMASFSPLAASSQTYNLSASFSGLSPSVVYYAQTQAINNNGIATAFVNYGSTATPTAAPGAAAFSAITSVSLTANWLANGDPAGTTYYAQISTMASFSPILASSQTFNLAAVFSGLNVDATYYAQAAAYNLNTATWTAFTALGATSTLTNAPSPAVLSQVYFSSLSFTWAAAGNPAWTIYSAQISTDNFATLVNSTRTLSLSATFFGLVSNATYYLQVQAVNNGGLASSFVSVPSTWTVAATPGQPSGSTFTAVSISGLTVNWSSGTTAYNGSGTVYVIQISTNSNFNTLWASTPTTNLSQSFSGLAGGAAYYAQVQALINGGGSTAFTNLGSTVTSTNAGINPQAFSSVYATSVTANWLSGFGPGTTYYTTISTGSTVANAFSGNVSSNTYNLFATMTGLTPNTTYYGWTSTAAAGPYTSLGPVSTLPAPPGPGAPTLFAVTTNQLSLSWSSGTAAGGYNLAGTTYAVQLSTMPGFAPLYLSAQTTGFLFTTAAALAPDTTFYLEVGAIGNNGASAFANFGATSTLAVAPGLPLGSTFTAVTPSALTVNWSSGTTAYNGSGTVYSVQISTNSNFNTLWASTPTASLSQSFAGLTGDTMYYAQVQAFNNSGGVTAFTNLGSTGTATVPLGPAASTFTAVAQTALTVNWSSGTSVAGFNPPGTFYLVELSTMASFNPTLSSQTFNLSASFTSLSVNATYYAQAAAYSVGAGNWAAFTNLGSTSTLANPPPAPSPTSVYSSSLTFAWGANSNPAWTTYLAQISTDNFATVSASSRALGLSAAFQSLTGNATYFFEVEAFNSNGLPSGFSAAGSTWTLPAAPASAPPTNVSPSSVTANWGAGGNAATTLYLAQVSTDSFATINASSASYGLSATFTALASNTTCYFRVQAIGNGGLGGAFTVLPATTTLLVPPAAAAAGFTSVGTAGLTVNWASGGNGPGTIYSAQLSTDNFASIGASSVTLNLFASFASLASNATYYARVQSVAGANGSAFLIIGSTDTLAAAPGAAVATFTAVSGNALTVNWSSGAAATGFNAAGTLYIVQLSTMASFSPLAGSSQTYNLFAAFTGLAPNIAYYAQVQAMGQTGIGTAFVNLGSTAPPTASPGAAAFSAIGLSTVTANWLSNGDAAGTTYYVQISTMPGLVPVLASSQTFNLSATFTGLSLNTTYYAQAAAYSLNTATWTAFTALGAAATLASVPASPALLPAAVSSAGLSWSANGDPAWTSYVARISTDNFATVVNSTRTSSLSATFVALASNQAYYLEVQAVNGGGIASAFTAAISTWTFAAAPSSAATTGIGALSMTGNWGANGNAAGTLYTCQISSDSGFAWIVASSATYNLYAPYGNLTPDTTYYMRVQANGVSGPATAFTALPTATTPPVPPGAGAFSAVSSGALTASWTSAGNGPGTSYTAQLSTNGFSTVFASSTTFSLTASFSGLTPNTTYSAQVQASGQPGSSAFTALGATSTLAAAPVAAPFSGVNGGGLTVNWSAAGNPAGTLFVAQISTSSAFATLTASSQTLNVSAVFSGLSPDNQYYAQVEAINNNGLATGFTSLGSTATTAAQPVAAPISALGVSSIAVNWLSGGIPAGTTYYAQISTSAGLSPILASSQTFSLSAVFTGLSVNVTYYAQVAAFNIGNSTWTAFTGLGSASTLANAPASPALSQVNVSSLTFSWSANGDPAGTSYLAQLSTDGFNTVAASSGTASLSAAFSGLASNATYFFEVRALSNGGIPTVFAVLPATWTLPAQPASAAPAGVSGTGLTLDWGANGNAAGTLYLAQLSADGFATVAASSATQNLSAAFSGLLANTAYSAQVQAVGNGGGATAFTALPSTTTLLLGPGAAASPLSAVSLASVTVNWTSGGNGAGTGYTAQISTDNFATVNASSTTFALTALFGAGGQGPALRPNATYYARVQATNGGTQSAFLALGSTITLASAPTGTAVSAVTSSSATLSWSLGANPAATVAEVQQSTDGVAFAPIYAGAVSTVGDGGLLGCTTYYVKVRNRNGGGIYTSFDNTVSFTTLGSTPVPAIGLSASPVAGGRVALSWTQSPSVGVTGYRLFYDAGTGTVNYGSALAVLTSTETSFTTSVLPSSSTYVFALRARNSCGVEETTGVFALSGSTAAPVAVRAAVTGPDSGRHVNGNSVSVVAKLVSGTADRVQSILFQFRASGTAAWANIVSADLSHANPASAQPYFIHWDVTGLAPASYDVRAVATDLSGNTDNAPSGITVVVDPVNPDISETVVAGQQVKTQTINSAVTNTIQLAGTGTDNLLTSIVMPAGALSGSTVAVTVKSNFILPTNPQGFVVVGQAMQVTLSNGQSLLAGGLTAPITLSYPASVAFASGLEIHTMNETTQQWSKDFSSTVDTVNRTVTGATPHFSVFVIVNAGATMPDLARVRVWPNPFKPTGPNADEGRPFSPSDPTSGIVFDQLPAVASLKIYTISGRLVAHFDTSNSNGRIQWDARNDSGHDVASGIYMAVITSPGQQTAVKKVAIIR